MKAFLGLGGNLGDRGHYLQSAIRMFENRVGEILAASQVYVSEPWGGVEQPEFWNLALEVETTLEPLELLRVCQRIEQELGRERTVHWGPRTIDIDILLCDNVVSNIPELILPHPHLEERAFVLTPLREIAPKLLLPSGRPIADVMGDGKVWPLRSEQTVSARAVSFKTFTGQVWD
ncbi:MAG: 2-amino-4-hydroxy-6-hydroxymethyldihydropteridine diphosphokinase [Desulfitobacteriaceae bacterium]